jgi:acetate kinase
MRSGGCLLTVTFHGSEKVAEEYNLKAGGKASAWVIATDEDLMIARHSWALWRAELLA